MKIAHIETTVLALPYTKPLMTATNNFTVARGLLVKVDNRCRRRGLRLFGSFPAHWRDAGNGAACHRGGIAAESHRQGTRRSPSASGPMSITS